MGVTPTGTLDFGSVAVGSSTNQTFTVTNAGGGTLTGAASTSTPYSIVSGGSYSLTGGQNQTVTVGFSPTSAGAFSGTVNFTGGGGAARAVTGTGGSASPQIGVTPTETLDFGSVAVGSSTTQTFTVTNAGGGTLTGAASTSTPYSIVSGGSYSLTAGQNQAITVRFSPTSGGAFFAAVNFTGGRGATRAVTGIGMAVPPRISVTPPSSNFGRIAVGDDVTRTFTVTNIGGGTLTGSASTSAPFSIASGGSYNLSAGEGQAVVVRFSPTSAGTFIRSVGFTGAAGAGATLTGIAALGTSSVPRMSQGDVIWGERNYDHTNRKIKDLGCALTCVAMVLSYHSGDEWDPDALDLYLGAVPGGYQGGGVNWWAVPDAIQVGQKMSETNSTRAAMDTVIQAELAAGNPVIVRVDSPTHPGGDHFVLITQKTADGRYLINDPGFSMKTNIQDNYANHIKGVITYRRSASSRQLDGSSTPDVPAAASDRAHLEIAASGSVSILVTDPNGRRSGRDAVAGVTLSEIPSSTYTVESIGPPDPASEPGVPTAAVSIPSPVEGIYKATVGSQTTSGYHLEINGYDTDGKANLTVDTTGSVSAGQVKNHSFTFSKARLPLNLSLRVNKPSFVPGETLTATGTVTNSGLPEAADFYLGLYRPDGNIEFMTAVADDGGVTAAKSIVMGTAADLASFQPLATRIPLATPISVAVSNFYARTWRGDDPPGDWTFRLIAVKADALADGVLNPDEILGVAIATFIVQRSRIQILDHTMSHVLPAACAGSLPHTSIFHTNEPTAYSWVSVSGATAGDKVDWSWYRPDGRLYQTASAVFGPIDAGAIACAWDYISIVGSAPATTPGNWSVSVSYNGTEVFSEPFVIVVP